MIQTYIRDEDIRARWDINNPTIKPHHLEITRGWIETADTIRSIIREGDTLRIKTASDAFHTWLYGNIERVYNIEGFADYRGDFIIDAYLEWGVKNYPITDKITEHTLAGLDKLYSTNDPETMLWDGYTRDIGKIIQYQTERNGKPIQSMSREEMIRRMQSYDTDTLRKMLTAVEYQQTA